MYMLCFIVIIIIVMKLVRIKKKSYFGKNKVEKSLKFGSSLWSNGLLF